MTDDPWELLRPILPMGSSRCDRWRDHRRVIRSVLYRIRTGVRWGVTCPNASDHGERSTNRTGCGRLTGTWESLVQPVQATSDAAGKID
ncbi:transposase [Streptomyces lasalocidi]